MSGYTFDKGGGVIGLGNTRALDVMVAEARTHDSVRRERVLSALVTHCGGMTAALDRVSMEPSMALVRLDGVEVWRGAWVPDPGVEYGMIYSETFSAECPPNVRAQACKPW